MPGVKSKAWCFTINNYAATEPERLVGLPARGTATYIIFGRETGDSGTPHLQGYVEYSSRIGKVKCRELLGGRAHVEARKGTQLEAITYCKKDGDWSESGNPAVSNQGARTDLQLATSRLASGQITLRDFALEDPDLYCRYRNGLRDIAAWVDQGERPAPTVYWIWGSPGTGKSYWAHRIKPNDTWSYSGSGWFDGYTGQSVAIFDDFADDDKTLSGRVGYSFFLKLLDPYKLSVPVKGGFTSWRPRVIVFTSNRALDFVYTTDGAYNNGAVRRRFQYEHYVCQLGQLDGLLGGARAAAGGEDPAPGAEQEQHAEE